MAKIYFCKISFCLDLFSQIQNLLYFARFYFQDSKLCGTYVWCVNEEEAVKSYVKELNLSWGKIPGPSQDYISDHFKAQSCKWKCFSICHCIWNHYLANFILKYQNMWFVIGSLFVIGCSSCGFLFTNRADNKKRQKEGRHCTKNEVFQDFFSKCDQIRGSAQSFIRSF